MFTFGERFVSFLSWDLNAYSNSSWHLSLFANTPNNVVIELTPNVLGPSDWADGLAFAGNAHRVRMCMYMYMFMCMARSMVMYIFVIWVCICVSVCVYACAHTCGRPFTYNLLNVLWTPRTRRLWIWNVGAIAHGLRNLGRKVGRQAHSTLLEFRCRCIFDSPRCNSIHFVMIRWNLI